MTTKSAVSYLILVLANIILCIFIFISINFSLLSPEKIHELISKSIVGFTFKRVTFSLLIALIASGAMLLIFILLKNIMKFQSLDNKKFFGKQFLFFALVALLSVTVDLYIAIKSP